jgi:homoserine O-succinyltransferase
MFNHLEYDTFTLSDEYQRDLKARPDAVRIPENYFPDDDPAKTPRNSWRAYAHLLVSNWINETYQHAPFHIEQIGRKGAQSLGTRRAASRGAAGRAKEGTGRTRRR